MALFKFRVVLCRIRLFPTFISKIKLLGSELPLIQFLEQLLKAAMEMEEINLSQLVIYQQEEQQRKNKVKRKVFFSPNYYDQP